MSMQPYGPFPAAELAYRREQIMADRSRKPRRARGRFLPWRRHRDVAPQRALAQHVAPRRAPAQPSAASSPVCPC
jgi:hypothetical protein